VEPLVSILIPAHNAASWVADTIQSALGQTWPRKEIILVDDGSTDETLSIARKFSSATVSVIEQNKQGAAAARNRALKSSQGDYIQWLDADDLLALDKVERQMAIAMESGFDKRTLLSGAWAQFIYRASKAKFSPSALWCDLSPQEWLIRKMGQNLHMQTATWLVSRELTDRAGPWDTRLSLDDDGEYFCRVLRASIGTRFVPEARVFYRAASSTSLCNVDGSREKIESYVRSTILHVQYIRSFADDARVRSACLTYLQRRLPFIFPERPDLVQRFKILAADLGGHLETPKIGGVYFPIQKIFGFGAAKRLRSLLRRSKNGVIRAWDRMLSKLENEPLTRAPRRNVSASAREFHHSVQ
jgi:glycosyltransferase involved in cell wall biosynthesis